MKRKKWLALVLAAAVAVGTAQIPAYTVSAADTVEAGVSGGQETVTYNGVTFYRASSAYTSGDVSYEGLPLYNGNEDDLDTYVDLIMEEIGLEGWIDILSSTSPTGTYTDADGNEKTYTVPIKINSASDVGLDGQTQWPNQLAQAQTWNTELLETAGSIYGDEMRSLYSTSDISTTAVSAHTAQIDARMNPLSGRYDEGYGEDSYLIGEMADAWSSGMGGDESDVYVKTIALTKHWTTYNSEFFRLQGGNNVSSRTFYEYYAKAAETPVSDGNILGYMSSYGNMNGVPATSTFIHDFLQNNSLYGLITGCDYMSEYGYLTEQYTTNASAFSNGYDDVYSSSLLDRTASMLLAGHKQGGTSGIADASITDTITTAVENSVEGLSEDDIYKVARPTIVALTRAGVMDERDENGEPRYYPYTDISTDHTSETSQTTELQMAEESVVLLKNEDNTLPLSSDSNAAVYGIMAETMQYGQYSSELDLDDDTYNTYVEGAGDTILEAVQSQLGEENVTYATGNRVVAYETADGYVKASDTEEGAQLTVSQLAEGESIETTAAYQFEYADWGQEAFSLYSVANSKWVEAGIKNNSLPGTTMGLYDAAVTNTGTYSMKTTSGLALAVSNMPLYMSKRSADEEDTYYLKMGDKYNDTDFSTTWALSDEMGWYLQTTDDGTIQLNGEAEALTMDLPYIVGGSLATGIEAFESAEDKTSYTFKEITVKEAGADSETLAAETDYAIVVIGQPYNGLSGEGVDRKYLSLSEDQMDMVSVVAANYAAEGKKTIVIINTEYPVEAEDLQNDDNVSAIVFNAYGGQYDATALVNILYGEANPTGRLVSTWYKSQDSLPQADSYVTPNNAMVNIGGSLITGLTADDLDEGVTVDMTETDMEQYNLTYMYADADDVTYEFGYGLSYSDFEYSDMTASANADGSVTVTVKVTNTGSVDTSDVVQIYASNPNSAYNDAVADKELVGFSKVAVAAGQTETVTITVDSSSLEVWDVNAGEYVVESGTYSFYAAHSSDLSGENVLTKTVDISAGEITVLDTEEEINIWSKSYTASGVKYVEYSKGETAAAAAADTDEMFAVMAKESGAYVALSNVNLDNVEEAVLQVASTAESNTIEIRIDSPDGKVIGTVSYGATEVVTQTREAENDVDAGSYTELGYTTAVTDITQTSGTHDVYLVFGNADARAATLQLVYAENAEPDTPDNDDTDTPDTENPESASADTLVVRRGNIYYFSYSLKSGEADKVIAYGKASDDVLVGDWDGDGVDTLCVRRGNMYYFSNSLKSGEADKVIAYGKATDEVLVGDWDGDGIDTLCVRRGNTYYFSDSIKGGEADTVIAYGKAADTVVVGKWSGNASGTNAVKDTLCVRRGNTYYFSNSLKSGEADSVIAYGKATDAVLAGDWDGDGYDTLTVRRGNSYYISNTIKSGEADQVIAYGKATDEVYAGTWK